MNKNEKQIKKDGTLDNWFGGKQTVLCAKMYNTTLYFRIKTELELIQSSIYLFIELSDEFFIKRIKFQGIILSVKSDQLKCLYKLLSWTIYS